VRVYRIVRTNPPTIDDFKSNQEKGLPARGLEKRDPTIHRAVSTWDALGTAEEKARAYALGDFIAEMDIDEAPDLTIYQHSSSGHLALIGPAQALLGRVVAVTPVRS